MWSLAQQPDAAEAALVRLDDPSTVPPLVALLDAEPVPSPVLIETLSGFGEAALDALTAALDSPAVATRLAVVEIVGRIGGESPAALGSRCAELVGPPIDDPDPQVRLTAVLALGDIDRALMLKAEALFLADHLDAYVA